MLRIRRRPRGARRRSTRRAGPCATRSACSNFAPGALSRLGSEYIGAVVMLGALASDERERFPAAHPVPGYATASGISLTYSLIAPGAFTAEVWRHFERLPGSGADLVAAILAGETLGDADGRGG